jgi:catechol 2,3-dioxygenase-like lactoylglutathione lyase family enzyme
MAARAMAASGGTMSDMRAPARLAAAALAGCTTLLASPAGSQTVLSEPPAFHHLHLVSSRAEWLADYYASLFAPSTVTRGVFWNLDGVKGTEAYLLVSRLDAGRRPEASTAIWHFGWGRVSVGETYRAHYVKEVNWRPPYAALEADFHVHLRSRDPIAAGRWYRDVLGGSLDEGPPLGRASREDDRVDAIVHFRGVLLAIHRSSETLAATTAGGPVDHLAFMVRDPARAASSPAHPGPVRVSHPLDATETVSLAGPDGIVIELLQAAREPAFWGDRPR